jgi:hypothetical protein
MKSILRKLISVLATLIISAGSLLVGTTTANAVGTYYPSGPQRNIPISTITSGGWTLCWSTLYNESATLASIESSCTKKYLLEAGGAVGASDYILAAAGERSSVLKPTGSNETNLNNGTYWYYTKNISGSMGFSPISAIRQSSADCYYNGTTNCEFSSILIEGQDPTVDLRLSWHINSSGSLFGGWRLGRIGWLNASTAYVRAIYQSDGISAPSSPTSIVATSTGKRSATVSFAAPASDGGSAVTSYTATSSPGGITQTLTQATGGTFNFDGLQPGTAYTFAVTATNAIGTSAAATSSSLTTTPLVVASLSSLSFADDGTGTGGKIVWAGKNIDAVLYTGPAASYPGPFNFGAFTGGWNGRIRNLTPDTSYTVSINAISADGVGESKSLTFKTSATLPALAGAASTTISRADEMTAQLPKLFAWIDENTFVEGEGNRMKMMLNKFDALVTSPHRSHIKVPTSRVLSVVATSLTPLTCSVVSATAKENAGVVKALSGDTCTISYTVSGGSRAPATMVKDFVFKKFAK